MSTANELLVAACTSGISCLDEMNLLRVIAQGAMSGGGGGGGPFVLKAGDTMTGALLQPAGSAAAPALARSTDPDTGIWYPAANTLGLAAGGDDVARITTGGINVTTNHVYLINSVTVMAAITAKNDFFMAGSTASLAMTGTDNISAGAASLSANTSGSNNSAFGSTALSSNTTGGDNFGLGAAALVSNTSGSKNIAIGTSAMASNVTGANSIAIGYASLVLATGSNNIALGFQAGQSLTTGAKNLIIGYNIDAQSNTASNQLTLGNALFGTTIDGSGTSVSSGNLGAFVTAPSARFHLPAGTATASTSPLKFTAGTLLTTPEIGSMEFTDDGTTGHLYITVHIATVVTRVQLA